MPLFQATEVQMDSGVNGVVSETLERVQSATISVTPPRIEITSLGRFKPYNQRPIINYTPVSISIDTIKSSKQIESNFGLVNPTGVGTVFGGNTDSNSILNYGSRNFRFLIAPNTSNNYLGQIDVRSGCLTSYQMSASIGAPAKVSFTAEGLDQINIPNNGARAFQVYDSQVVTPQNVSITGITFSGNTAGVSGLSIQSVNLAINITRQPTFQLGQRLPKRNITAMGATLSINGFLEGVDSFFSGLSGFNCGNFIDSNFYITLLPACADVLATTYIIQRPYFESQNFNFSVGNFAQVDLNFAIPLSIVAGEIITGSNLIIL